MPRPVAIFGELSQETKNKISLIHNKIKQLGYVSEGEHENTIPHLTLAVNFNFDEDINILRELLVKDLHVNAFDLPIRGIVVVDEDIAVKFDNSYPKNLARKVWGKVMDYGFEVVETDYMKIIRSKIKQEYQAQVEAIVKDMIPSTLRIVKISAASKNLRQADILWTINLI